MANRTIQFFGYAYGNVPVQMNAFINGQSVFSGAVDTLNENIPVLPTDMTAAPVLFSVAESALFPTTFSGSYPMTVSVATGNGILLGNVYSNYMPDGRNPVEFSGSVSGTTLTVSSITSGEIAIGQTISNTVLRKGTKIVSGNGSTWEVSISQAVSESAILGYVKVVGTADVFLDCFTGTPPNSDGTNDARSSVQINGMVQPRDTAVPGEWTWQVDSGSTIECNLNVSLGSE
jgi:hypothetical protein